jgi:hypothetical protein
MYQTITNNIAYLVLPPSRKEWRSSQNYWNWGVGETTLLPWLIMRAVRFVSCLRTISCSKLRDNDWLAILFHM